MTFNIATSYVCISVLFASGNYDGPVTDKVNGKATYVFNKDRFVPAGLRCVLYPLRVAFVAHNLQDVCNLRNINSLPLLKDRLRGSTSGTSQREHRAVVTFFGLICRSFSPPPPCLSASTSTDTSYGKVCGTVTVDPQVSHLLRHQYGFRSWPYTKRTEILYGMRRRRGGGAWPQRHHRFHVGLSRSYVIRWLAWVVRCWKCGLKVYLGMYVCM